MIDRWISFIYEAFVTGRKREEALILIDSNEKHLSDEDPYLNRLTRLKKELERANE